jgi:hypothetical protein
VRGPCNGPKLALRAKALERATYRFSTNHFTEVPNRAFVVPLVSKDGYIVPHSTPSCQLGASHAPEKRAISPQTGGTQCLNTPLVHGTARQSIDHTTSRKTGPRKWLRAVRWLIEAGLHPKANATTLKAAEDLAQRMDYDTGHVLYQLDETAARLRISRASVKRHVGYLRELGTLAWVQHGSRINIRRAMGLKGYAATATIYAAVIPPAFDHAMGHTIVGSGYGARIVIDMRNQAAPQTAPKSPVDTSGNTAVDSFGSEGLEPPSLTWVEEEGKLKVDGGEENYTSRKTASRDHASIPGQRSNSNSGGSSKSGRHALQVAEDIRIAAQVRPLVNWAQRVPLRPLAFCLRPLIDKGMDAFGIAAYLNGLCTGGRWRPRRPAAYIRAVLADQAKRTATQQAATDRYELENCPVGALKGDFATRLDVMAGVRRGMARYQQECQARGLDALTGDQMPAWDAEADILAFLNGSPA